MDTQYARHAARVVRGAVDRIDDPEALAVVAAILLADDGVVGEALGDRRADEALDLAVHLGHHVVTALHRDGGGAEGTVGKFAGVARKRPAEVVAIHYLPSAS